MFLVVFSVVLGHCIKRNRPKRKQNQHLNFKNISKQTYETMEVVSFTVVFVGRKRSSFSAVYVTVYGTVRYGRNTVPDKTL